MPFWQWIWSLMESSCGIYAECDLPNYGCHCGAPGIRPKELPDSNVFTLNGELFKRAKRFLKQVSCTQRNRCIFQKIWRILKKQDRSKKLPSFPRFQLREKKLLIHPGDWVLSSSFFEKKWERFWIKNILKLVKCMLHGLFAIQLWSTLYYSMGSASDYWRS